MSVKNFSLDDVIRMLQKMVVPISVKWRRWSAFNPAIGTGAAPVAFAITTANPLRDQQMAVAQPVVQSTVPVPHVMHYLYHDGGLLMMTNGHLVCDGVLAIFMTAADLGIAFGLYKAHSPYGFFALLFFPFFLYAIYADFRDIAHLNRLDNEKPMYDNDGHPWRFVNTTAPKCEGPAANLLCGILTSCK